MDNEVIPEEIREMVKGISIRARMALAITCLESVLSTFSIRAEEKSAILETFWQFVEDDRMWKWDLDRRTNDSLMIIGEYINHVQDIPKEYSCRNLPDFALRMVFETDELGMSDLYGEVCGYSKHTFASVINILRLMVTHGFPMPSLNPFLKSSFQDNGGWGSAVPRTFFTE
jgi:hypothetical protein